MTSACQAAVRHARYQHCLWRDHSRRIRPRELEEGDWILRRKQYTKGMNKFSSSWEVPYRVVRVLKPGVACLETEEVVPVKNSWNIDHLRRYHLQKYYP